MRMREGGTLVRGVLFAAGLAACSGDPSAAGQEPVPPGIWTGTAGPTMTFVFVVDPDGHSISRFDVDWTGWVCGDAGARSGSTSGTNGEGWPIVDREFDITIGAGIGGSISFAGTFSEDDVSATGSWGASLLAGTCSGTWTASR